LALTFRVQLLLGQCAQRPSINQYMEGFGRLVPQTLLSRSRGGLNGRPRIFSPLVTFRAFLAQVLELEGSCLHHVRSGGCRIECADTIPWASRLFRGPGPEA
jgi:hypothetical protein